MEIINAIINKPDWEIKFKDTKIINKWISELESQGINKNIINKVIELLDLYLKENDYDGDNHYNWIINPTTLLEDIGLKCNGCECLNCNDCYYSGNESSDYDSGDDPDGECRKEYRRIIAMECTCNAVLNLSKLKKEYLDKFIVIEHSLINSDLKQQFVNAVTDFRKNKEIDYHPGTNNTVINIIHPSLYCYVDGVTIAKKNKLEKPSLFQWIPANYSQKDKKFTSQINNCDNDSNENVTLYNSIETIFDRFIPHFQNVLDNLHKNKKIENKINLHYNSYDELQVIVKIGSTQLSPNNTKALGTGWHLEGIREENIIATGIYYYDFDNVTDSHLCFRTAVDECDINYPQGKTRYVETHYGLMKIEGSHRYNEMDTVMELSKIKTKEDMCLVFPNFLQHRVEEFELQDKTKDGNRNILVFFLIDPRKHIISTSDIINNDMSLEEAKMYRELLMFQRKYETKDQKNFYERGFSLCEH